MERFKQSALELTKARIGLSTNVRNEYLEHIIESIITELSEENGLSLQSGNSYHLMFVVDYSSWRYESKDHDAGLPRHLQFRMHNLILNDKRGGPVVR